VFFVFELKARTRQTNGQTNRTSKTGNAAY